MKTLTRFVLASVLGAACAIDVSIEPDEPTLLSWSEQIRVREGWLAQRYALLLPMMRRHEIDMWIVVNEEFHDDPLTEYIAPPRPYTGRRDIFVFIDAGDVGLRRIAITGYAEENIARFFESADDPRPASETLPALFEEHDPQRIGIGTGGSRGMTRSLTHDSYTFLVEAMGPDAASRFVSAGDLIDEYLDTRTSDEMWHYTDLVELTESLTRRVLSNETITVGETTIGELRMWLYDQLGQRNVGTWFQPDFRVQRATGLGNTSRGFLAVAAESTVVRPGDLLHLDFGISYMGFDSDWQKMAYVLKPEETDVPDGLKAAITNTNTLQDALTQRHSRPNFAAGDVFAATMAEMDSLGIEAQIYSHPLGNHGHGMGAAIDFRSAQRDPDVPQKLLRLGSYISIELNTRTEVAEWDGQGVYVMMEDPAHLTEGGWRFFRPRQTEFYLIR